MHSGQVADNIKMFYCSVTQSPLINNKTKSAHVKISSHRNACLNPSTFLCYCLCSRWFLKKWHKGQWQWIQSKPEKQLQDINNPPASIGGTKCSYLNLKFSSSPSKDLKGTAHYCERELGEAGGIRRHTCFDNGANKQIHNSVQELRMSWEIQDHTTYSGHPR